MLSRRAKKEILKFLSEAENIRENGTFDFSYLDEEWEKIMSYIRGEEKI